MFKHLLSGVLPLWAGLQLVSSSPTPSGTVQIYPIPSGVDISTAFDVKVRVPSGRWQNITLFKTSLAEVNFTSGVTMRHPSSVAHFDFNGTIEISATYNNAVVEKAVIRPESLGIQANKSRHTVHFKLTEPQNVFLQVNDDVFDGLHLFANSIDTDAPHPDDKNVVYFGPGLHQLPNGLAINSSQTVYVAGGAVLKTGDITFTNVTNATLRGRGVLLPVSGTGNGILAKRSKDITIDGIVALNMLPRAYECNDVAITNTRVISSVQWGDGIDIYCSNNVMIDRVFLRTSDDCVAVYNHRNEWYGDSTNITLQNSALWADLAHPINIGTHGDPNGAEKTDGVIIRNNDIMDHREGQVLFQGCIALNAGDNNVVQNVLVDDVRVENFRLGQLFNFRVMKNSYNTQPGLGIRNVTISNVRYNGNNSRTSIAAGYDGNRTIEGITFKNLTINGNTINPNFKKPGWYLYSDYIPMFINEHVKNVTFS